MKSSGPAPLAGGQSESGTAARPSPRCLPNWRQEDLPPAADMAAISHAGLAPVGIPTAPPGNRRGFHWAVTEDGGAGPRVRPRLGAGPQPAWRTGAVDWWRSRRGRHVVAARLFAEVGGPRSAE